MRRNHLPFKFETTNPCTQSWDAMAGGREMRHCESCDKHVHNFGAMTPAQIEEVVLDAGEHLCARISRRADGSLTTLGEATKPSFKAGLALSASLAFAGTAAAQSTTQQETPVKAVLTGTILLPDGSGPVADAVVTLENQAGVAASTKTDATGNFTLSASPGTYDIRLRQNVLFGNRVLAANLHEGEQSLQPIRTHFATRSMEDNGQETFVTVGEVTATLTYPFAYAVRHPWRYLKHLTHTG
jgi:hypothetical protein